jgi:FKBP-type peptidyl-prolyl cis-trans isomerase FkpA
MNKKYVHSILLFLAVGLVIFLVSCNQSSKYRKEEKESIANYLNTHSTDTFTLEASGLYYRDVLLGTGPAPVEHDTATVIYTGKYLDGTVFDSNVGLDNLVFPVEEGAVIPGFLEGIYYMKQGGKAQFLIPSSLAYGPSGYEIISGYTPLLYDVELVLVKPGPGKK